jgi:hypothetical protein
MGNIVASASSAYRNAYEWWQSLEPSGLAVAFFVVVFFVFAALWFTCRAWSPVFWKRTDYAYFFFVIIGGAAGAADLAVSSLNKELAQIQMNMLTNAMLLRGDISSASLICDKQRQRDWEQAKEQAPFGRDVIKPPDVIEPKHVPSSPFPFKDLLSSSDCATVTLISSDIQEGRLKPAADYRIEEGRLKAAADYGIDYQIGKTFDWKLADIYLMTKIAASIGLGKRRRKLEMMLKRRRENRRAEARTRLSTVA